MAKHLPPPQPTRVFLPACGKKWILSGIGSVVLGFGLLTFTDPAGQNWASTLSPLLLVVGYALIGIGLVQPTPSSAGSAQPARPSKSV